MTTSFHNTGLPLWVFIVIVVVGSAILLATIAVALRCWHHRRKANKAYSDGLTGATRRMTVRRGRMVPTSQHLSLTGSRFGMKQFGLIADNESTMTGRRSPFEWWNTMVDRSQSRQDQMSQVETGSLFPTRPSSRATSIATRREFRSTTPTRTPEKVKEPVTKTTEITIPSPTPSHSPSDQRTTVNYSRSFVSRIPTSPLAQRSQNVLSLIEETSPRHSVNGLPPLKVSTRLSYFAAIDPLDSTPLPGPVRDSRPGPRQSTILPTAPRIHITSTSTTSQNEPPSISTTLTPPLPTSRYNRRSVSALRSDKQESNHASVPEPPRPKTADAAQAGRNQGLHTLQQNFSTPRLPNLTVPKPVATSSLKASSIPSPSYRQPSHAERDNSKRTSATSRRDSVRTTASKSESRKSFVSIGPSGIVYDSQLPDYWSSRTDLQDLSATLNIGNKTAQNTFNSGQRPDKSASKDDEVENVIGIMTVPGKNNTRVLRKKSMKRIQMASSLN